MTNRPCGRPPWKVHINVIQRREGDLGAEHTEQATRDDADTAPRAALPWITTAAASSAASAPQIGGAPRSSDDRAQLAECTVQPTDRASTSDLCAADSSRSVVLESAAAPARSPTAPAPRCVRIGVLALQGAFIEHIACLDRLAPVLRAERHIELHSSLVRTASELAGCDGLILPGGESTAMRRLLAESPDGLLAALQCWVCTDRPLFGTCAGCIMLADRVVAAPPPPPPSDDAAPSLVPAAADHSTVSSSVSALGGIDMTVARNYFGRQLASFHARDIRLSDQELRSIAACTTASSESSRPPSKEESTADDEGGVEGVFIRAPAILQLGASVRVLATLPHADTHRRRTHKQTAPLHAAATSSSAAATEQAVAVRSGRRIATCFHPELTNDLRWHAYFVDIVLQHQMTRYTSLRIF